MTRERAEEILKRLEAFNRLERKATDEAGWIALCYGKTPWVAKRMIEQARGVVERDVPKAEPKGEGQ